MSKRVLNYRLWRPSSRQSIRLPQCHRQYATQSKYWNREKLATTDKYPLSKELYNAVNPSLEDPQFEDSKRRERREAVRLRPQIVSPALCDEALAYYGHNLAKHKGCDILDLNPGIGLWSSKIHDYLQPRSHILLEPQIEKYERFLNPLLDKSGSKYKLAVGDPTRLETFEQLIRDGYFPHQKVLKDNDAGAIEPNDSLLIIGSIAWEPILPGLAFDSMAKQLFFKYSTLAWQKEMFHTFGQARMLLWFLSDETKQIMPRSIFHAAKSSFTVQKFSHVTEVVGPRHGERKTGRDGLGREPCYEIESLGRALKAMKENGMELPAHRREPIHDFAEDVLERTNGSGIQSIAETTKYLHEQLLKGANMTGLMTDKAVECCKWEAARDKYQPLSRDNDKKTRKRSTYTTKEEKAAGRALASMRSMESKREAKDPVVELGEDIYKLECKILGMDDGEAKDKALADLKDLQLRFDEGMEAIDRNYPAAALADLDDRLSLRSGVPRILWDGRLVEPLVMNSDEAWPPNDMSLADIQPRPVPEGYAPEDAEYFHDFLYALMFTTKADIPNALERLQPGASALIDEVPILRDPARGGRLNLEQMRVRMLTVEMVDALCSAYREWPFKNPEANHPNYFRSKMGDARKRK